jgi:hypothetical protein
LRAKGSLFRVFCWLFKGVGLIFRERGRKAYIGYKELFLKVFFLKKFIKIIFFLFLNFF